MTLAREQMGTGGWAVSRGHHKCHLDHRCGSRLRTQPTGTRAGICTLALRLLVYIFCV